jgi:hypothetical protein
LVTILFLLNSRVTVKAISSPLRGAGVDGRLAHLRYDHAGDDAFLCGELGGGFLLAATTLGDSGPRTGRIGGQSSESERRSGEECRDEDT